MNLFKAMINLGNCRVPNRSPRVFWGGQIQPILRDVFKYIEYILFLPKHWINLYHPDYFSWIFKLIFNGNWSLICILILGVYFKKEIIQYYIFAIMILQKMNIENII